MRSSAITLSLFAVLLLGSVPAFADPITIFNTGVNSSGGLLTGGGVDPHYTLSTSADSRFPGPDALVVVSSGYPLPSEWFTNNSTSQWIAPQATNLAGSGEPGALADGVYIYTTTFDLTGFDLSTAILSGLWSTDNAGLDILINGISTGFTTALDQFGNGFAQFSITTGFVSGVNTLDFVVQNGAPGYFVNSPTGLRVEISGTADSIDHCHAVSEPGTLVLLSLGLVTVIGCGWRHSRR